jgi:hypothetical protein
MQRAVKRERQREIERNVRKACRGDANAEGREQQKVSFIENVSGRHAQKIT